MQTEALVKTEAGEIYLKKLCRRFARKVPATLIGSQALIEFSFGRCRIDVDAEHLHLSIALNDPEEVDRAERLLTEHLLGIACREQPQVRWERREDL